MKKTLLAIAVAATAATSVNAAEILKTDTASVDFYGQLRQELKQEGKDANPVLKSGSSRAGVNARYTATDSVDVLGSFEFAIGDSSSWTVRKHYVGLDFGDAGTLTVGKQSLVSDDVWGAENSKFYGGTSMLSESGDGASWLQQGMIKYVVSGDAGWVNAAYSADNDNTNATTAEVFAGTDFGNVSVYGGAGIVEDDTDFKHVMLTVAYNADKWNIGVTGWHKKNDDTDLSTNSVVVAGRAEIADKTSVYSGYEFVTDYASEDNDFSNVYVGVEYVFSSWARTYAEFSTYSQDVAQAALGQEKDDSLWGVGVRVYW